MEQHEDDAELAYLLDLADVEDLIGHPVSMDEHAAWPDWAEVDINGDLELD